MKHQKFLNKISFLSSEELIDFKLFLNYYFHSRDNLYVQLISILSKTHPNYQSDYDEKKLYKKLYKDHQFNIGKLNNLFTSLNKALEDYIVYNQIQKQPIDKYLIRIKSALVLNDQKSALDEITDLKKQLKNNEKKSDKLYKTLYELSSFEHQYYSENDPREGDINIQLLSDSFDKYLIIRKLEIYSMMLSRKQMFNIKYNTVLIDEIIRFIPNSPLFEDPLIHILYLNIQLQREPTESNYLSLLHSLEKNSIHFTPTDLRAYYSILENMLPSIYIQGQYNSKIFELYKIQIEKGIILSNNKISATLYNNIVTVGLRLGELKWVNDFIEQYKKHLQKDQYQDYYTYNKARVLFIEQKYEQIQKLVHEIEYKNVEIKLGVKRLLSKVFYELREFSLLEHHLKSLKIFIFRHSELSESHQELHKIYLKHFNKLYKIAIDPNRSGLKKLILEIEKTDHIIDKNWILEKLNNMK